MVLLKQNSERNEWLMAITEEVVPNSNDTVICQTSYWEIKSRQSKSYFEKTSTQNRFTSRKERIP